MDKQEVLLTTIICTIAVVVCYVIFGKDGENKNNDSETQNTESMKPCLSNGIPSNIIGPSQWNLLTDAHKACKTTKIFTKNTVPRGLTSRHNTKQGVFGLIHVIEGELKLTVFANKNEIKQDEIFIVKKGQCAITAPQQWHKVSANSQDMKFYVEFWS